MRRAVIAGKFFICFYSAKSIKLYMIAQCSHECIGLAGMIDITYFIIDYRSIQSFAVP
jgi:hypothetical protein